MIRRRRWNTQYWKWDVLARLKKRGCPICTHHSKDIVRDFFWFVNEHYYEPEVIADLRRSYGFCPLHTRHLLGTGASSVITTVFSYLTEYVIARFQEAQTFLSHATARQNPRDRCRQAAEIFRPQGICRACRDMQWWDSHIITSLLQTLPDAEVQTAYQKSSGLCLPHFHKGGLLADWDALSFLTADMCRRLKAIGISNGPTTSLFEQVAGLDRERSLRLRDQKRGTSNLPVDRKEQGIITLSHEADLRAISWSPTFEQTLVALAEPGCPICAACKRGLQDYVCWLAQEMETKASPSAHWDPAWQVCSAHFWELCAAGHERAAALVAERVRQDWISKLDTLAAGMAKRPSDRLVDRLAAVSAAWSRQLGTGDGGLRGRIHRLRRLAAEEMESPERKLDLLRVPQFRESPCQACFHIRETTRRTIDLILRVVEDPSGRLAYHQGWGLCLRHCITAAGLAEEPFVLSELLKAQVTRLRLLEWELEEASRKMNWSVRYEPGGPEEGAWRRAAYQFYGV